MKTSIALISKSAPYGTGNGQELLDLALAGGSFGQTIGLFFIEDGVYQLVQKQQPEQIEQRNYSKTFAALPFYDIDDIYVCQHSLDTRGLCKEQLCIDLTALEKPDLQQRLSQHQHIISL